VSVIAILASILNRELSPHTNTIEIRFVTRGKLGILREMLGGQQRITPSRDLEPRYTGKTLLTNRERVPLITRITFVLFLLGFIGFWSALAERAVGVEFVIALVMIACSILVCIAALFGIPPFQLKKRPLEQDNRRKKRAD
jgi:hypothetical protein